MDTEIQPEELQTMLICQLRFASHNMKVGAHSLFEKLRPQFARQVLARAEELEAGAARLSTYRLTEEAMDKWTEADINTVAGERFQKRLFGAMKAGHAWKTLSLDMWATEVQMLESAHLMCEIADEVGVHPEEEITEGKHRKPELLPSKRQWLEKMDPLDKEVVRLHAPLALFRRLLRRVRMSGTVVSPTYLGEQNDLETLLWGCLRIDEDGGLPSEVGLEEEQDAGTEK